MSDDAKQIRCDHCRKQTPANDAIGCALLYCETWFCSKECRNAHRMQEH